MTSQTSRKIIVAGSMAVVVGIGVVTFALRSHPVTPVAQVSHPPAPPAQAPAAPAAAAPTPDAPATVAQIPDAPAADSRDESRSNHSPDIAAPSAIEPKLARHRHLARAGTSAVATNSIDTHTGSAVNTSATAPAGTVANSGDRVKSADELTTGPATSAPAEDQKAGTSTEFAASDSQITTDVKSEIAGDNVGKDANIGVTTTHGVVALTGNLASQDAIDHVKEVAGKVKDVKSVDTSALTLASL